VLVSCVTRSSGVHCYAGAGEAGQVFGCVRRWGGRPRGGLFGQRGTNLYRWKCDGDDEEPPSSPAK